MNERSTDFAGLGSRSAEVAQELRADIEQGRFTPGSKLPTEAQLCARFGYSRPTIRRGVSKLAAEGLVTVRAGAGMFVNARDDAPRGTSRYISIMMDFSGESLAEVQDMVLATNHMLCTHSQLRSLWDPEQERRFLEGVLEERHKGLIAFCSPREPRNDALVDAIAARGTRVVHIEPYANALPAQSFVLHDYRHGGSMAATALLLGGYEDFRYAHMGFSPFELLLEEGFADVLRDCGNGYDPERDRFCIPNLIHGPPPEQDARVEAFVAGLDRPTGILCRALHNAEEIRDAVVAHGLRVPEDIGLITLHHGAPAPERGIDMLRSDRMQLVHEALAAITAPTWSRVRRLVKPSLLRAGSVRPR